MFVFLKNLLSFKCPRCHEGKLFVNKWYSFPNGNKMVERCSVCGQRTELEPGFFQGTGYVSYGLTVGFSLITFAIWVYFSACHLCVTSFRGSNGWISHFSQKLSDF
jgi:uncharacterized protein (DUF983 family)